MVKNLEIEERLSKAKITIYGFNMLSQNDIQFLKDCLEDELELIIFTGGRPDRHFKYLGEQCCVMNWLVDDTFIVELDFNDCLE